MGQPTDNSGEDTVPEPRTRGFEELYAEAGDDLGQLPWARLAVNPELAGWLDTRPAGGRALVIGCGYGDDAEDLARRGYAVTAFDLSATAIDWCRKRFPESAVDYRVADLFTEKWDTPFDLVVELYTIQSLPPEERRRVVAAVAAPVADGGTLFVRCFARVVRCFARADDAPVSGRPWPVSRAELAWFGEAGLTEVELRDEVVEATATRFFTAVYTR